MKAHAWSTADVGRRGELYLSNFSGLMASHERGKAASQLSSASGLGANAEESQTDHFWPK